jgi:hypothetical protein
LCRPKIALSTQPKEISMNHITRQREEFEQEARELRRQWAGDLSVRWLLALDSAIRRSARGIAALGQRRG